ncbi:MAG: DUF177 domain-containing protein [Polyangiales bacterium]
MSAPPVITIDQIPQGEGLPLDLALDPSWLSPILEGTEVKLTAGRPARASVRLDLDGRDVILSGSLSLHVDAECVACLAPMQVELESEFQLLLEPAGKHKARPGAPDEVELSSGELDVDEYQNDRIDLARWLREQILLEVPAHPRHPEECPEPLRVEAPAPIEPTIDPRLMPLMKFAEKKE